MHERTYHSPGPIAARLTGNRPVGITLGVSETRDRIIATTSALLTRQGYHATGLNQIVRESGTPRGSLYHYFPHGKEELAAEAVRHRGEQMRAHVTSELGRYDDPARAIVELVRTMVANLVRRDFETGAPVAAVAMEASSASETLRAACETVYAAVREPIEAVLRTYGLEADVRGAARRPSCGPRGRARPELHRP